MIDCNEGVNRPETERASATRHARSAFALAHSYTGERELWARDMRRVMSEDGGNPRYRWFTSGGQE